MAQAEICVTWARSGLGPFQLLGQNSSIGPLANSKCRRLVNWVGPFAQMGSRSNLMPERGSIRTKFIDGCASCRSLILCSQHKLTAHPFLRELVTRRFWPCQCLRWAQLCTFQRHPYVPFTLSWFSLSRHVCGRVGQIWVRKCQDVPTSKHPNQSLLDDAWFLRVGVRGIWWHLQFTPRAAREVLTFFWLWIKRRVLSI